jgi:hypothetical protein
MNKKEREELLLREEIKYYFTEEAKKYGCTKETRDDILKDLKEEYSGKDKFLKIIDEEISNGLKKENKRKLHNKRKFFSLSR